jgi:hypothetical protein
MLRINFLAVPTAFNLLGLNTGRTQPPQLQSTTPVGLLQEVDKESRKKEEAGAGNPNTLTNQKIKDHAYQYHLYHHSRFRLLADPAPGQQKASLSQSCTVQPASAAGRTDEVSQPDAVLRIRPPNPTQELHRPDHRADPIDLYFIGGLYT